MMVRSEPTQSSPAAGSAGDEFAVFVFETLAKLMLVWAKFAWMALRWAVAFPMLSLPAIGCAELAVHYGWPAGTGAGVGFVLILLGWRLTGPDSFRRWVSGRIWKRWRRWSVYRRPWPQICALHGLTATLDQEVVVPKLHRARVDYGHDRLSVRMLLGQTVTDWQGQSEALAHAFGALTVRVHGDKPGWVVIEVQHADPLTAPIPIRLPDPLVKVDLESIPVGVDESGAPWQVRVLGRHVLVAGATGAGKGSVVWSILTGLAPAIRTGLVQAWVIDPKGGMEFGAGQGLFTRFAYDTGHATVLLLREAVQVMTARADSLRGITRQHTPSASDPLVLLVIDELASLTAYTTDRKMKTEIEQLLGLLLSQGRAVGVSVIACVQDPAKDVLALRQLFPTRIALRLTEASQVAMILGASARERGALCELIPDSLPGVGYIAEDGRTDLRRVRAFHVTDPDIDSLAATYRPTPAPDPSPNTYGVGDWPQAA